MNMGCVVTTGDGKLKTSDQQSPKVQGSEGAGLILAFWRQPCDHSTRSSMPGRAESLALIGSKELNSGSGLRSAHISPWTWCHLKQGVKERIELDYIDQNWLSPLLCLASKSKSSHPQMRNYCLKAKDYHRTAAHRSAIIFEDGMEQ